MLGSWVKKNRNTIAYKQQVRPTRLGAPFVPIGEQRHVMLGARTLLGGVPDLAAEPADREVAPASKDQAPGHTVIQPRSQHQSRHLMD